MVASHRVPAHAEQAKPKEDDPRRWAGALKGRTEKYRPLPAMLEALERTIAARGDRDWIKVGQNALRVCDHWANLAQDQRDALGRAFPNAPEFLGEWSGMAWVSYLNALLAVQTRRECARNALREAVARGGGAAVPPAVWDSVCGRPPAERAV